MSTETLPPLEYTGADEFDADRVSQELYDAVGDGLEHSVDLDFVAHARVNPAGPVTVETGDRKCDHGVRISPGDAIARYCGVCNPTHDSVLARAMARKKPACRIYPSEKTLDLEDYLAQPVGTRISSVREFQNMEER